jgi:MoaA/NifB/PqqE/SkfB family radical SAM enzyme
MGMMWRLLRQTDKKCLYKLVVNLGIKGVRGFRLYQKRLKEGKPFPAFHFISVTDDCNLNCQGCWVVGKEKNHRMDPDVLNRIITETKAQGSYFFGILGGEPLLYKPLFEVFEIHQDAYFQLFTNGTLLNSEVAEKLRKAGNVTPLISFEGDEVVADIRRGGKEVYRRTMDAVKRCTAAGLFTGVAISVCKSNFEMALSETFIQKLINAGVGYLWYYIYRPVGENPSYELALSPEEINALRSHMVEARTKYPLVIIDAYWDDQGRGLCPAASGLSHHINASGYVEPCPVIQLATDRINGKPLEELYRNSAWLEDLKSSLKKKTNGCILMDDPAWLAQLAEKHQAVDTSGRNNEYERLRTAPQVASHGGARQIPEKSFWYRFAKKHAFFGLGAYG